MVQFLGDIAFLFELSLIAAGLVLIHIGRDRQAGLLQAAGWILAVGGGVTALCTSYFWFSYHAAGEFDHAGIPFQLRAIFASSRGWIDAGSATT